MSAPIDGWGTSAAPYRTRRAGGGPRARGSHRDRAASELLSSAETVHYRQPLRCL